MVFKREIEIGGRTLSVEVGKVAKQSDGAAWVQYGDTVVLAAVNSRAERGDNTDFFPLTVDYREKKYGGGKIPGGFFKREARPHDKETLIARMTDRALRPLFAKGYYHETQVLLQVYSHDQENEGDILAQIGATIALLTSDIPFDTPVVNVRVGRIGGQLVINPTIQQLEESDLEILVAGTEDAIAMVEGEGKEISEDEFLEALDFAHAEIKRLVEFVKEFQKELGKPTREWEPVVTTDEIAAAVKEQVGNRVNELITIADKSERKARQKEIKVEIRETLAEKFPESEKLIGWGLEALVKDAMRSKVMADKVRIDSRKPDEIRPISVEAGLLPRAHGSSLFTRGQTQALGSCTLGTKVDEQKVDGLEGEFWRTFMLHYNFPPFCTGEVKRMMGTNRRELGHGHLAERALKATLPDWDDFPYTVRLVSEVLESNGSSSMASVCAGSLALMDCGVPVKKAIAGIAMGLIKEGDDFVILSDILGDEDALGDMDFKVAGSRDGITAFQMDIKIAGISRDIMAQALAQAKAGREHILGIMDSLLPEARPELSKYAPTILNLTIDPEYIGMIIGPGGKMIRALQTDYGVNIEIDDDGMVSISSTSREAADAVKGIIRNMTREPEIGEEFDAKVVKIVDFGAFVELFPGKEGLVHVSELEWKRVDKVTDILNMGDTVRVKLVSKTAEGKLDLSRKALLPKPEGYVEREKRPPRPGGNRGGGNRGGGGGGRRR